jgi:hypothetical protein
MRIVDIPDFEVVELQIADKNGSYEEDVSFIVVYKVILLLQILVYFLLYIKI